MENARKGAYDLPPQKRNIVLCGHLNLPRAAALAPRATATINVTPVNTSLIHDSAGNTN